MRPGPHAHRRGVGTAEALVGTAIALSALATTLSFLTAQQKALAVQSVYSESQTVTRTVIDLLTRELRMAAYDPLGTALATSPGPSCPGAKRGLVEATANRLRFRQDLDGDGAIGGPGEDLTYELARGRVWRRDGREARVTLVENVPPGGLRFRYFDGGSPPRELVPARALSQQERDCVAVVRVAITASVPRPHDPGRPLVSTGGTDVALRNRPLPTL